MNKSLRVNTASEHTPTQHVEGFLFILNSSSVELLCCVVDK